MCNVVARPHSLKPPLFLTLSLSPGFTRRSFPAANTEPRTARLSHRAESKGGTGEVFFSLSLSGVEFCLSTGCLLFFLLFHLFFFLKMSEQVSSLTPGRVARVLTDTPVGVKPATF